MGDTLSLRIKNDLAELDRVNQTVEEFLEERGVPMRASYHIRLALDELITNTISHGCEGGQGCEIVLDLSCTPEAVSIILSDDAKAFDPLSAPPPDLDSPLEERRVGGLGVHFVRTTMDEARYSRENGRNVMRLLKKLG
ncbi:hypothetical protein JCM15519_07940 [Fundidesulfovibrio butyratiphilus]